MATFFQIKLMNKENIPIDQTTYINLSESLKEKNPKLFNKLPAIVLRSLEKIIKQKEANRVLSKYSQCNTRDFLINMIKELNLDIQITGEENLPEDGRCFFAGNHPFGIADGLLITHIVSGKYGSLKAIANEAFMLIPQLRPFIAVVDVYQLTSRAYIQALDKIYKSDTPITHFPAGEVSRWYNKKVQDTFWQKSFISKSVSTQRDIVPIYFHGKNSRLFYFIFKLRNLLGIKLNIELALLPREFFKKKNSTIKIVIGKPIPYTRFTPDKTPYEWAQIVRAELYDLEKEIKK